jgi:hypothetical protein
VFFFGLGWRLGDPHGWPRATADEGLPPAGWPVKVFCAADPDPVLVAEQLAVAAAAGLEPWVETHAGGPDVRGLLELAERSGAGVVLDLLGLAEIGGASTAQLRALAPFIRAAQVKGVHRAEPGIRHRPLAPADLAGLLSVLHLAPLRAVTVESRAGTHDADLVVLADAMRAAVPKSVIPIPSQESP